MRHDRDFVPHEPDHVLAVTRPQQRVDVDRLAREPLLGRLVGAAEDQPKPAAILILGVHLKRGQFNLKRISVAMSVQPRTSPNLCKVVLILGVHVKRGQFLLKKDLDRSLHTPCVHA